MSIWNRHSLWIAALGSALAGPTLALPNWHLEKQDIASTSFEACERCTFVSPDRGATFVGSQQLTGALTVVHYTQAGVQSWLFEDAGNFQFPQGPIAASMGEDGSICALTQDLLPELNSLAAIRLAPDGTVRWKTLSLGSAVEYSLPAQGTIDCMPDGGATVAHDGAVTSIDAVGLVRWSAPLSYMFQGSVTSLAHENESVLAGGYVYFGGGSEQTATIGTSYSAVDGTPNWSLQDGWQLGAGDEQVYSGTTAAIIVARQQRSPSSTIPQLHVSALDASGSVLWDTHVDQEQRTATSIGTQLDTRFALTAIAYGTSPIATFRLLEFDNTGRVVLDEPNPPLPGAVSCALPAISKAQSDAVLTAYSCISNGNAQEQIRRIDAQGAVVFERNLVDPRAFQIGAVDWNEAAYATAFGSYVRSTMLTPAGFTLTQYGPDQELFSSAQGPADTAPFAMESAADGYFVLYGSPSHETLAKLDVLGNNVWEVESSDGLYRGTAALAPLDDGGVARIWRATLSPNQGSEMYVQRYTFNARILWRAQLPAADLRDDGSAVGAWQRSNGGIDALFSEGLLLDVSSDGSSLQQYQLPLPAAPATVTIQNGTGGLPWAMLFSGIAYQQGSATCWARAYDRDSMLMGSIDYPCQADSNSQVASFVVGAFDGVSFITCFYQPPFDFPLSMDLLKITPPGVIMWDTALSLSGSPNLVSVGNGYVFVATRSYDLYGPVGSAGALLRDDGTIVWQRDLTDDLGVEVDGAPFTDGSVLGTSIDPVKRAMNTFAIAPGGTSRYSEPLPVPGLANVYTRRFGFHVLNADQIVLGTYLTDPSENRRAIFGVFGDDIYTDGFEPY